MLCSATAFSSFNFAILAIIKWYENWLMLNIVVFFVLLPVARKFEHYVVLLMTSVHFALIFVHAKQPVGAMRFTKIAKCTAKVIKMSTTFFLHEKMNANCVGLCLEAQRNKLNYCSQELSAAFAVRLLDFD